MISIRTIQEIKSILLSERVSFRGNEIISLNKILSELNAEENAQILASRVKVATAPVSEGKVE